MDDVGGEGVTPPAGMRGELGPLFRLVRDQRVAFLIVGGINTVVGTAWYIGFQCVLGTSLGPLTYMVSLGLAHVFAVLTAFVLYRRFVFRVRGHLWLDLARFEVVNLGALAVNAAALPLLVSGMHLSPIPAQLLVTCVSATISYLGHRDFSFRRTRPEPTADADAELESALEVAVGPLVSIVIPTFNNADVVEQTVRSVLAQTYRGIEVIIADHASSDGTWEVVSRYAGHPQVTLLRTPAGGGAKRNWNAVSRAARGELLKLVCGDDLLDPGIVERQVEAFRTHPSAELVANRRRVVDARGGQVVPALGLGRLRGEVDGRRALRATVRSGGNLFGEPMCVMMRRSSLEDIGWWDDREPYYIDLGTYAHLLARGTAVALPEVLASFRVSASQWSVRLAADQRRQASRFHRTVLAEIPGTLSRRDVLLGDIAAVLAALRRRAAYLWLGARMRP